jgi:hypothetical protein
MSDLPEDSRADARSAIEVIPLHVHCISFWSDEGEGFYDIVMRRSMREMALLSMYSIWLHGFWFLVVSRHPNKEFWMNQWTERRRGGGRKRIHLKQIFYRHITDVHSYHRVVMYFDLVSQPGTACVSSAERAPVSWPFSNRLYLSQLQKPYRQTDRALWP